MNNKLLIATTGLLNKLHGWAMPGLRAEYMAAMRAVLDAGATVDDATLKLVVPDMPADALNGAIYALERAKNYPCLSMYQVAEIDSAILAIRSVVGFPEVVESIKEVA